MAKQLEASITFPKTLIVGVDFPFNPVKNVESYYEEFINLVKSLGVTYDHALFMKLRQIDGTYYLTKGKLQEVADLCAKEGIEDVIFSVPLSVQQERNLSKLLKTKIFDRTQLILEIFEKGATSAEGKIQVALALLQHRKARLTGQGISMSQQAGSIGNRGPGETQKEKETQHIEYLMLKMRRDLKQLQKTRETQRKQRLIRQIPSICLIGYTNSGKSTILNMLTKSDVLVENKLFATLDTTTRELYIEGEKKGVISDTVGFIQQLPTSLIEAFKSTLSELMYANLLLHVIDASDPNWEEHILVVHNILEELQVEKPVLYVFNKIDKVADPEALLSHINRYQPHITTVALSAEGILPLKNFLQSWKP